MSYTRNGPRFTEVPSQAQLWAATLDVDQSRPVAGSLVRRCRAEGPIMRRTQGRTTLDNFHSRRYAPGPRRGSNGAPVGDGLRIPKHGWRRAAVSCQWTLVVPLSGAARGTLAFTGSGSTRGRPAPVRPVRLGPQPSRRARGSARLAPAWRLPLAAAPRATRKQSVTPVRPRAA